MSESPAKTTNRSLLFAVAEKSCRELREYLSGERKLTGAEVEVRKVHIQDASRESFYFFAKQVLGYKLMTNETHKKWADDLQQKWLTVDFFMRLKPRGTYKTTLYGIAFLLWVWGIFSPEIRFFYTSANQTLLEEVSAELDRIMGAKAESLYSLVFDVRRNRDEKNTWDVFNISGKSESRGFSLIFRTAGGSTNGVHPHIIIIDDPLDKEDRESQAVRTKKERWFDSLTPLLVPFELKQAAGDVIQIQKMMFITTRWHLNDLVSYVRGKAVDWDFEVEGVFNDDGAPRYPEFFPLERIEKVKSQIHEVFFACQYLNDPLPEGHRLFDEKNLHFVRREQIDLERGTNYCFFDPSQGKAGGDFPAVVWLNIMNGRRAFFHAIDKKMGLTPLIALIAKLNRELRVKAMVFETNGAMTMENTLDVAHKQVGHSIGLIPIHETRNKEERIAAMQPDLYNGSWFFPTDWADAFPEMRNQIIFYPAWGHDDFPDVVEKAVSWAVRNMPGSFGGDSKGGPGDRKTHAGSLKRAGSW